MTSLKKTPHRVAALVIGATIAIAPQANAAIVTVDDSGSWINGSDAIAQQGFDLIQVPNGSEALSNAPNVSELASPLGGIAFSPAVAKRQIGNGWTTWSNNYAGEVYAAANVSQLNITLPNSIKAFDFYAEPNVLDQFNISAIAQSGTVSNPLTQLVSGNAGARYYGFYSTDPLDPIRSIQISADPSAQGFAIGQLRVASAKVPTPALLPAAIGFGLGLWRKRKSRNQVRK